MCLRLQRLQKNIVRPSKNRKRKRSGLSERESPVMTKKQFPGCTDLTWLKSEKRNFVFKIFYDYEVAREFPFMSFLKYF